MERLSPDSREYAIELTDLTVRFAKGDGTTTDVLRGIDFQVTPGEFVVLVGRSGGGKTTLLNAVAGLVEPAEGTIRVLGGAVDEVRSRLGFMFARDALLPWRTAQKNVEYPLELRRVAKKDRAQIAREQLERVHLAGHEKRWPWQLSQGMRQRVALARTWAPNPELLLMDEPFAALDSQTRTLIRTDFLKQWQESANTTVLFVTHDLVEAAILGQRILVIDGGVVADIKPKHEQSGDEYALAGDADFLACLEELKEAIWAPQRGEQ